MKKKILGSWLCVVMVASMLAGCGAKKEQAVQESVETEEKAETAEETEVAKEEKKIDYPTKPIEIVVPAKAGGDTDLYGRLIAQYMEKDLGVSVTVSNVVGGGGSIGSQQVHDSETDGYTMMFGVCTNVILNHIMGLVDYDYSDFEIIGIPITDKSNMLVASSEFADKSFENIVEDLKADPGCYTFGTEVGSLGLLSGLALEKDAEIEFNLVDAGTIADRITALLGGQIDFFFAPYASVKDYLKTGEMVSIALFSSEEQQTMPGVKTFESYGYKNCTFDKAFFAALPKGTDEAVVELLRNELEEICNNADFIKDLENYALVPNYLDENASAEFFERVTEQFMLFENDLNN